MEARPQRRSTPPASCAHSMAIQQPWQRKRVLLSCGGGEPMKVTIQFDPVVYDHIRTLVHDELNEQKNRQKIEQLATKIRGQLDQLSGPNKPKSGLKVDLARF